MVRLKAFTLLELLIAMAVSAVLLNLVYLALYIVQGQQQRALLALRNQRQLATLQWILTNDFRRSRRVTLQHGELSCDQAAGSTMYQIQDSLLIRRQQDVSDTFSLPGLQARYWPQRSQDPGYLVEAVAYTFWAGRDSLTVQARMHYDAQEILAQEVISTERP